MNSEERLSLNTVRKFFITNSLQLKPNKIAKFYKKNYCGQQQDFREVHQQDLLKHQELQKFQNSSSSATLQVPSPTLPSHRTWTLTTLRSASCSPKHTENTPITAVRKVCLSVSRHCLSCSIEQGNLWEKVAPVHTLGTLLDEQRQIIIAECCEKVLITNSKQLEQNKNAKFLKEELWCQQQEFREVHQKKSY